MLTRRDCAQMFVDIARTEVGQREETANRGPSIEFYQRATTLAPAPWPWCAAFVSWVMQEWLKSSSVTQALRIADPAAWRFKSARAYDLETWARRVGVPLIDTRSDLRVGDILTYEFSHCGIVAADSTPILSSVLTIEGNTDADGSREGDGVWQKQRNRALIRSAIRIC